MISASINGVLCASIPCIQIFDGYTVVVNSADLLGNIISASYSANAINNKGGVADISITTDLLGSSMVASIGGTNRGASVSLDTNGIGQGPFSGESFSTTTPATSFTGEVVAHIHVILPPNSASTGGITDTITLIPPPQCTVDCSPPPVNVPTLGHEGVLLLIAFILSIGIGKILGKWN